MPEEPSADLTLIARQLRRILSEVGAMRDDLGVLKAILQRLDGTTTRLVNEVRAFGVEIRGGP